MRKKSIVESALILTIASIITKILGFVYRIYMSKTIGAEGMGLYQLIIPVYVLAWSISCSGFTTTISKLVAAERGKREYGNMGRILKQSFFMSVSISIVLMVSLFFLADFIAVQFFHDDRIIISLKVLAICFPFMAGGSCIRGYFFGLQDSTVPAISQVLEQVVRMSTIYFLSGYFLGKGLSFTCLLAIIGIVISEICGFLYVVVSYKLFKTKNKLNKRPTISSREAFSMIMVMAIPLTANKVSGSFLSTFENMLIPIKLQEFGLTQKEALSLFGMFNGMATPLVYFPSAMLVALSISLVPAISEAQATKNYKKVSSTTIKTLLFTMITGIWAGCVFIIFAKELGLVVYNINLYEFLLPLGFMCPLLYLHIILSGILNGLGEQVFIFISSLLHSIIVILFIYFLVPNIGMNGLIYGVFASLAFASFIEIVRIKHRIKDPIKITSIFLKPILCGILTTLAANLIIKKFLSDNFSNIFNLCIGTLILSIIYSLLIFSTGCITSNDIKKIIEISKKYIPNMNDKNLFF